jgi:hypothetical protein
MKLIRGPSLPWDGAFPYDTLSGALVKRGCPPVTTESTIAGIKDAFFDLMGPQSDPSERAAWDQLRIPESRLVVDFFLYPVDDDHSLDFLESVEMPVYLPDFRELVRMEPEPRPDAPILNDPPPLDLGDVPLDLLALTGDDDE